MKVLKQWYRKLVPLRAVDTTPQIVLERTLDKVPKIKAVALVILWDDDTYDMDWSRMKISEFALMATLIQTKAQHRVHDGEAEDYRT